jgi:hypothetical protein
MTTITNTSTMSNTKREPLLSAEKLVDEFCEVHPYHAQLYAKQTACWVRDFYEADRAKDADLIQQLVDGLHKVATLADVDTDDRSTIARDPLYAAEAAGFKPTEP